MASRVFSIIWPNPRARSSRLLAAVICSVLSQNALAFSQAGHMVSAAIAYEDLSARAPAVIDGVVDILSQHPDRGTFEVAVAGAGGAERARHLMMEAARWPDDIRKGVFDHPTWHYASRPLEDSLHPLKVAPPEVLAGSAIEAFALNVSVLRDVRAPISERAIALCWVLHLVGDIHQPLHTADEYSTLYGQGDRGGGLQYVLDPVSHQAISLHWLWDMAGTRGGDALVRAAELRAKLPRTAFAELAHRGEPARDFIAWAGESYALARSQVFAADLATAASEAQAPELPAAYVARSVALGERRVTLAGYRIADLLIDVLRNSP
jgi:S1/P1 Nuclease